MKLARHATTIALVLLAAGAAAYEWLDRASVATSEQKARASNVFVGWRREDLTRIALDQAGHDAIALERTNDDAGGHDWWLRAPANLAGERADADAVDKLVASLEFATVVRKVDPTLHAPGLDAPRAKITLAMGAITHVATLGADAPTPAGAAYLRVGDATVVVGKELVTALLQSVDTYRSRLVVPYLSVGLSRLEVRPRGAAGFAIERADETSFTLDPGGLRASREKLDGVWSALAELRAESFLDDAVATPLIAEPTVRVTMTPTGGRAAGVLRLGAPCPGHDADVVVVRDGPTRLAACAPGGSVSGLSVSADALVDTHLFTAHDDEMAEVRLESVGSGAAALELARKDAGWRQRAPVDRDLTGDEAEAAATLTATLAKAEGRDVAKSDAPFTPVTRATVHRADGVVEVVEVGAPDANGDAVLRRKGDGARLVVSASVARLLAPRSVALRGREVWTPRIEGARAVVLETKCGDVDQKVTKEGDAWTMARPTGFTPDNASILDVVDAVERLRAESWAADADDGRFGLGACSIALTIDAGDGGARTVRVELGQAADGGVYARTSADPAVFVAPKVLADRARAWLIDEHGFAPSLPIDSVLLEKDGRRVAIASSTDAGGDEDDDAIREASVLRADDVVHLGAPVASEGFARPRLVATIHGASGTKRVTLGAPRDGDRSFFARVGGVDATFAIDRDRVKAWLAR